MTSLDEAAEVPKIIVLWRLLLALALAFGGGLPGREVAEARFLEGDADQIDPEQRYGTETYNDKVGYRYPVAWHVLWDEHDVGYRVHAGSLNVNRFDYAEDVKVRVHGDGELDDAFFAFEQSRREDTLEQRTEREVRLGWRLVGPLGLYAMADGGTYKEYGDVGFGVRLWQDRTREVRAYFWSVDHFYATKKSDAGDEQTRKSDTVGIAADWRFGERLRLRLDYEWDHPLRWRRPSRGYVYEYERQTLDYRLDLGLGSEWTAFLAGSHEQKAESKTWTLALPQAKALWRNVDLVEVGAVRRTSAGDLATGVELIRRHARYRLSADPSLAPEDLEEEPGPTSSLRQEGELYATWHFPFEAPRHYLQVGAYLNQLRLREEGQRDATELKTQLAWDYRIAAKARVLFNTTWDLDQLQKDFPYREDPFRPWGGGDIQFIAVF